MALLDIYNFERELEFKEELEQERQEQEADYYASLDEVSSFILDKTEYLVQEGIAGRSLYMKADEVAFMKALMQTLPREQLENIKVHSLMWTPLEWVADDLLQQVPTAENREAIIKNEPIALLLDEFASHKKGRRNFVRAQLRIRFDAQDNDIQVSKIVKLL